MTGYEIMREVAGIGNVGINEIEETAFYGALNRAIERASKIRPQTRLLYINNYSIKAINESRTIQDITTDKPITLHGDGVASIYINTSGKCTIAVYCDGYIAHSVEVNAQDSETRIVISNICAKNKANVKVSITAHYAKLISYALWEDKISNNEADVPDTSIYNTYRLDCLASDFNGLLNVRKTDDIREQDLDMTEYILVSDRELWLLRSRAERIKIEYKAKQKRISRDNVNEEIDIDEDIAQLVVLLTAYWVWFEDLNEIAQNCYAQFVQRAAEIKTETRAAADPAPRNVYGW